MSVHVTSPVWKSRGLTPTQKLLLLQLADHADGDGRNAYPSVATMCAETGLSRRAVQGTLRDLESRGILKIERFQRASAPRHYRVMIDELPGGAPATPPPAHHVRPRGAHHVRPRGAPPAPPPRTTCAQTVLEPSLNRPTTISPARSAPRDTHTIVSGFDRFWEKYPLQVGKGAARKAWTLKRCEEIADTVVGALTRQLSYLNREQGKWRPLPTTWLNQERWQDAPPKKNGYLRGFGDLDMSGMEAFLEAHRNDDKR